MGQVIQFILGLVISSGALWLAFRNIDWKTFRGALFSGDIAYIGLGVVLILATIPVRGIRWRIFMEPVSKVSVRMTSEATFIGLFGNNILPFKLGELLRSFILARQASVSVMQVFGTVIVERVVDVLTLPVLIAGLLLLGAIPDSLQGPVKLVVSLSFGLVLVTIWLARREGEILLVRGRLKGILNNLKLGFTSLRNGRQYFTLMSSTIVIWLLNLLSVHAILYGMGLGLSLVESYLILVTVLIVMMIPAAPGYLGTYHAAVVLTLSNVLAVKLSNAQAAAVVMHAVYLIPFTIIGAIFYLRAHIGLRDIRKQKWDQDHGSKSPTPGHQSGSVQSLLDISGQKN